MEETRVPSLIVIEGNVMAKRARVSVEWNYRYACRNQVCAIIVCLKAKHCEIWCSQACEHDVQIIIECRVAVTFLSDTMQYAYTKKN